MDTVSKEKRSFIMSRIKSSSSIEVLPKEYRGLHLRRHPNIYGRPDFGNAKKKIAVFIDGCFWHGCKRHFKCPKTNIDFWENKIKQNIKRGRKVNRELKKQGFKIIRIWEHKIRLKSRRKKTR